MCAAVWKTTSARVRDRMKLQVLPVLDLPDDRHDGRLLPDALLLEQAQLALDLVDAVLPVAEEVEPLRAALQELAAELGADAAAGARDEHALAPHVGEALPEIDAHGAAGQEVLGIDLAGLDEVRLAVEDLGDLRHDADAGELGPAEDGVDPRELLARGAGDGDDRLVGGGRLEDPGHRLDGPEHRDAVDPRADLGRVVVEERDDVAEDPLGADLRRDGGAR